jgi:hypothetical protein
MRGTAIIHDGQSNFLGFNCQSWVPGMDGDVFEGTYPNAVRVARKIKDRVGRRIFISQSYGYANQKDTEILDNGDVGKTTMPNAKE